MKLLVLDVEGTLFRTTIRLPGTTIDSTIWQAIAQRLGQEAIREEVATHDRWARREYRSYLDWMKDTILIHQKHGLTKEVFDEIIAAADYHPGVVETLRSVDRSRFEIVLVTGGFRELVARVQRDAKVIHAFAACEYAFSSEGLLDTYNLLPCDFHGKIDFINLMLREYGLGQGDWLFVGDGVNDVPIAKSAPFSIGFKPHADLQAVTDKAIENFSDLLRYLH
jgi:phosphoserine phosphatase